MLYQFCQYIPPRSSYTPAAPLKAKRRDTDGLKHSAKPKRKPSALTLTAASPVAPFVLGATSTTIRAFNNTSTSTAVSIDAHTHSHIHHISNVHHASHQTTLTGTSQRPRPIPNSYWATPLLLACEYPFTPTNPDKPKLDSLLLAGVRTFIDLTESGELVPYSAQLGQRCKLLNIPEHTVEYHRFPIRDRSLPDSTDQMHDILEVLHDNASRGRISAVHCRGGIGRTGMVIGCWLVESDVAKDGEEALKIIAREWKGVEKCVRYPNSPETGAQFNFVFSFCPKKAMGMGGRSRNSA